MSMASRRVAAMLVGLLSLVALPADPAWSQSPGESSNDAAASTVAAAGGVVVLMRDMTRLRGTLVGVDERQITWRDGSGVLRTVSASDVVGIVRSDFPAPPVSPAIELVDGQRLPGRPILSDGVVRWRHDALGVLSIELERTMRILLDPSAPRLVSLRDDIVLLANGDRLDGVVTKIGSVVTLERGAGSSQEIPFELVSAISVVNSPEPRPSEWPATIWLADGSILLGQRPIVADDGIVRLRPRLQPSTESGLDRPMLVPLEALIGVLFAPDVLTPLAALVPTSVESPPARLAIGSPEPTRVSAPMGLSPLKLRGPLVVRYALEHEGMRLVAEAVMPEEALAWGDFELVVVDGGIERFRSRMNASMPRVSIDVELSTRDLAIRIDEGERGPIQDVVILHEAMLGLTER